MVHLYGRWRLLLAFPGPDVAVILDVGQHLANDPTRDVYTRLYEILDITPTTGPRTKPPCCDDTNIPPAAPDLLEDLTDAYRTLTRRRTRRRT